MKVTRTVLRDFMLKQAITNRYELRITDKNAMFYEIKKAIEWYDGENRRIAIELEGTE